MSHPEETANYLAAANKSNWFIHREDKIFLKGLGERQTFWLDLAALEVSSRRRRADINEELHMQHPTLKAAIEIEASHDHGNQYSQGLLTDREQRLIDWCVEKLLSLLKQIEAKRRQCNHRGKTGVIPQASAAQCEINVFDEVKEVITMPDSDGAKMKETDVEKIELHPDVLWQLNDFVTSICTLYRSVKVNTCPSLSITST